MERIFNLIIKFFLLIAVICSPTLAAQNTDPASKNIRCSVIGLGKLGSPLSAVLAQHFKTIGVDLNKQYVDAINKQHAPVFEPGLTELIKSVSNNLSATTDVKTAVKNSNVTFIIVPTPTQANGTFTNKYVLQAIQTVGAAIKEKSGYHLVNITSTVMPGSMEGEIKDTLELASGRKIGDNLGLTYNPEFIALGDVINGIEKPDMVLIGESSPNSKAGDILAKIYYSVCGANVNLQRTNYINAETAKLSLNTFLTIKVAYANTLGQVCDALPNADANVVAKIIAQDSRISPKFLKPGMPYGGPCLPRDTVAFSRLAKDVGANPALVDASKEINDSHINWILEKIISVSSSDTTIGIVGLSYKPGTDVIEDSPGIKLAKQLKQRFSTIKIFDPNVTAHNSSINDLGFNIAADLASCSEVDVLIITTSDPAYKELIRLAKTNGKFPKTIIDGWGMFAQHDLQPAKVVHLGRNAY